MKYISFIILFLLFTAPAIAQSLSITQNPDHSGYNTGTFPTKGSSVSVSGGQYQFADVQIFDPASWAISEQKSKLSFLLRRDALQLQTFDDTGVKLIDKNLEFFDPADNTLKIYQFDDGRTVVRDNVANFTFFDAKGERAFVISNSSQSIDGERESQLSADKAGRTLVLYNPVIAYGSETGSRARVVYGEEHIETLFNDTQREIKFLRVSTDGAFISLIATSGNRDEILIFDRFGNEIFTHTPGGQIQGVTLTEDASYMTTFAGSRMQVYKIPSGERIGSASSQTTIVHATYIPEDETIIGLGGSLSSSGILSSPTATAVHISKRQIAREQVDLPLSIIDETSVEISRVAAGRYKVSGLNRELTIRAQF